MQARWAWLTHKHGGRAWARARAYARDVRARRGAAFLGLCALDCSMIPTARITQTYRHRSVVASRLKRAEANSASNLQRLNRSSTSEPKFSLRCVAQSLPLPHNVRCHPSLPEPCIHVSYLSCKCQFTWRAALPVGLCRRPSTANPASPALVILHTCEKPRFFRSDSADFHMSHRTMLDCDHTPRCNDSARLAARRRGEFGPFVPST